MTAWPELRFNISRFRPHAAAAASTPVETIQRFEATVSAGDLAVSTASIVDGTPIDVSGELVAGIGEFEVRATIRTTWQGECRRCLDPVEGTIDTEATATFVDGELGDEADVYPIDGDWLDVGEVVREELMLALPLSPLCGDDCEGADPDRFPTTGEAEPETAGPAAPDPRWAALSELTFDED